MVNRGDGTYQPGSPEARVLRSLQPGGGERRRDREPLIELLERFPEGARNAHATIKELEHEGDRLTHEVIDLLNRTFVTPFDRDDMYRLQA